MTDEQIIKATDVCRTPNTCRGCPYHVLGTAGCISILMKDVFDFINRQKAEIGRVTEKYNCQQTVYADLSKIINEQAKELKQAKSEAIKEFAERLKNNTFLAKEKNSVEHIIWIYEIDKIVKEITEVQG